MNPQQPYGNGPASPGPEQYDFIMSAGNPQRQRFSDNTSAKTRLLVALGAGLLLIMIVWASLSLLSKATSLDATPVIALAERQNELIRISNEPTSSAFSQSTKNFAATTQYGLLTEQQTFLTFLKKNGTTPSHEILISTANKKTDADLKQAKTVGSYDQTYVTIAQSQLTAYEKALQQAYATAKNANEKQILKAAYSHAELLLQQSKQTQE